MPREKHSQQREQPAKAHWPGVFGVGQSSVSRPELHGLGGRSRGGTKRRERKEAGSPGTGDKEGEGDSWI